MDETESGGTMGAVDLGAENFNALDLFGRDHFHQAEAEALAEIGELMGHPEDCEAVYTTDFDQVNQALHANCHSCGWSKALSIEVVESIAAPIRRRLAKERSPVARIARNIQLADRAPLN